MVKIKLFIAIITVLLLSGLASAAVTIEETSVPLLVDYENFDQEDQTVIQVPASFTVKNTDPTDKTVQVSVEGLPTGYSIEPVSNVTVTTGTTQTVQIRFNITHHAAQGSTNIGNIVIKDQNNTELDRAIVTQNTTSMLIIKEIKIDYVDEDGEDQDEDFDTERDDEFSLDKNVQPGSKINLEIEIKNRFNDQDYDDSDIEEIELTVEADDSDIFPRNFDEEYTFDDLRAKEKQSLSIDWEIPDDADAGDYRLDVTIKGEDGKGIKYKLEKRINLDLRRARDDLRVTRAILSPSTITTCDKSFSLDVELKNYGTDNQRYAGFAVFNSELKINENIQNIQLDEFDDGDDTWRKTFELKLPANVQAKTYRLDLIPFIDRTKEINEEHLDVAIGECRAPDNEAEEDNETETSNGQTETTGQGRTTTSPTTPTTGIIPAGETPVSIEETYTSDDVLIAFLIVGIVIVVALIASFVVLLMKHRS